jgi:hypothetical protein
MKKQEEADGSRIPGSGSGAGKSGMTDARIAPNKHRRLQRAGTGGRKLFGRAEPRVRAL